MMLVLSELFNPKFSTDMISIFIRNRIRATGKFRKIQKHKYIMTLNLRNKEFKRHTELMHEQLQQKDTKTKRART